MKGMMLIILMVVLVVLSVIVVVVFSGGLPKRETGERIKEGIVVRIDYDVIFGGSFTDWRDDIFFKDGTILSSQGRDLSSIRLNESGKFYFDKNYFEYNECWYEFDNFRYVIYPDV